MKRIRRIYIYLSFLAISVAPLLYAQEKAPGPGRITGSVYNGTSQDTVMAGFPVEIQKFSGANLMDSAQTATDDEGRFEFQGLEIDPNFAYFLRAVYGEIGYSSEPIVLDANNPLKSIDLNVYEKSDDPSGVLIENYHIIIRRVSSGLQVQEILSVRNGEPYTYVGENGSTLKMSLPEGAENFNLGPGYDWMDYSIHDKIINFSLPVSPDENSIVYYYDLKAAKQSYELIRKMSYPVEKLDVILVIPGAGLKSDQLETGQPFIIEGQPFAHLVGKNLEKGSALNLIIEKLPVTGVNFLKAGLIAGFAFVISSVFIFLLIFEKQDLGTKPGRYGQLTLLKETLIKEIADLDEDFKRGTVKEDEYRSVREKKKIDLLEVVVHLENQRPYL